MTAYDDTADRESIRTELDRTLFVEAGAGSGKTKALVDRTLAIVLEDRVRLRNVAAVTFTEKAGAELRDRLRAEFENVTLTEPEGTARVLAAEEALDDLDSAAIGTLHSFAQRILGEHPIEAGLPPLLEVLDEVASQVAFEERWIALRAALLEDEELRGALLLTLAAGVQVDDLRTIALQFGREWDRLPQAVLADPLTASLELDLGPLRRRVSLLLERARACPDQNDKLIPAIERLADWLTEIDAAVDDAARLPMLSSPPNIGSGGKKASWGCDPKEIRDEIREAHDEAEQIRCRLAERAVKQVAYRIAVVTLDDARARANSGRLEFHDLLVLSRELLRSEKHGEEVRATLQQRYQRLLLDEFQDTDPIQIELAVRIAGGAAASTPDWHDVEVPPGRLFVVGDPKQSIYRFRRADIATYLDAQERIGEQRRLTRNFRSTKSVLAWVNDVFSHLIQPADGSQPAYQSLEAVHDDAPGGPRVLALGREAHSGDPKADELRRLEAVDVAAAISQALAEKWQVRGENGWRDARLEDIAVLVPARTSLPFLENALDDAGIPFRAEASSLVYRTPEIRDLLAVLRAIDDPSDGLSLVTALRSPLFGCGDDDLWTWKRDGGTFNLLAPVPDAVPAGHPVRDGIEYLLSLHRSRQWRSPSELLSTVVMDRRVLEVAGDGPRARDVWRRVRFVVDQARAWSEAEASGLRAYLAWAARQGDESARVSEAILPETDTDSVRIMTVHAAKGLEFPIVIVSGLSTQPQRNRGRVKLLWPRAGGYELKITSAVKTTEYDTAKPLDEQMDHHERLRLLYVACTRARDHLVVSLHRKSDDPVSEKSTLAELVAEASSRLPMSSLAVVPPPASARMTRGGHVPDGFAEWSARWRTVSSAAARRASVSASSLEGSALELSVDLPAGLEKGARNLETPPWNKGRYGSAVGRAVHGALQVVDLATGAGLEDAVRAQCLAEGVLEFQDAVLALCRSALASKVVARAASRPHWREVYLAAPQVDGTLLEGMLDLHYREDDGSLVVVDYKTDTVDQGTLAQHVKTYVPQQHAYVSLLEEIAEVGAEAVLSFLAQDGSTDVRVKA